MTRRVLRANGDEGEICDVPLPCLFDVAYASDPVDRRQQAAAVEPPVTALVACSVQLRGAKTSLRNTQSRRKKRSSISRSCRSRDAIVRQRSNMPSFNGANLLIFILQTSVGLTAD